MLRERLIQLLMMPDSAGMTLTPDVVAGLGSTDLRTEALQRLVTVNAPSPGQLRRIAELTEMVLNDAEARKCWIRAAEAGDEDAQDYLEALRVEDEQTLVTYEFDSREKEY